MVHSHQLGLTLGHTRAQVLLVVLVEARVIPCLLFLLRLLRVLLFELVLELSDNLVFYLKHLLLLVLILLETQEILLFFLIIFLHL